MMTVKLQIVVGLAILFILAILINMIRRRSLELKYALVWMLVLTALFVFDCAPALLNVWIPWNLRTGKYDIFPGILFFPAHYLFTDGGIVPPVQQCAYPGSDGGTQ